MGEARSGWARGVERHGRAPLLGRLTGVLWRTLAGIADMDFARARATELVLGDTMAFGRDSTSTATPGRECAMTVEEQVATLKRVRERNTRSQKRSQGARIRARFRTRTRTW